MAVHPLVQQLRFARSEFVRCLAGISPEDAVKRLTPMNCLSWMVGHLADQEQRYWLVNTGAQEVVPGLNALVGFGKPASTPPLEEMWVAWRKITAAADNFLDMLTTDTLAGSLVIGEKPMAINTGTLLYRNIYHYWFHTGEAHAVRQMLGHPDLPQFVGDMSAAFYRPESE
jgi:hypothetical protein